NALRVHGCPGFVRQVEGLHERAAGRVNLSQACECGSKVVEEDRSKGGPVGRRVVRRTRQYLSRFAVPAEHERAVAPEAGQVQCRPGPGQAARLSVVFGQALFSPGKIPLARELRLPPTDMRVHRRVLLSTTREQ